MGDGSFREFFRTAAAPGTVIPVWEEFHADLETPVSAYLKVAARFPDDHFLLESVEGGEKWARYSFIGFDPDIRFSADGDTVSVRRGDRVEIIPSPGDPMELLAGILGERRYLPAEGLPRLSGGAVGFIGYDYVRRLERLPDLHPPGRAPDAMFLFPSRLVVFDNVKHRILIVTHGELREGETPDDAYGRCLRSIAEVRDLLREPLPWQEIPEGGGRRSPASRSPGIGSPRPSAGRRSISGKGRSSRRCCRTVRKSPPTAPRPRSTGCSGR